MTGIKVSQAPKKDTEQLLGFFKHYNNQVFRQNRVDCYLSHNSTIVAKDKGQIVGILQWHIKENPQAGVAEFEEMFVLEECRGKGIGSALVKYAIQSVKSRFADLGIRPRKIFLFVAKENALARKLYQRHGFELLADAGKLFSDSKSELFYCLNLR